MITASPYDNNWIKCFNENNINNNTSNFILKFLLDTEVQFLINKGEKKIIINSNKIYLSNCHLFRYLYQHAKYDKLFTINLEQDLSSESLNIFFSLLHNKEFKDKGLIYSNIFELHIISDFLINDDIKTYCENIIAEKLNENNFGQFMEFCLIEDDQHHYNIINGRDRLFRYLIIWLKFFNNNKSYTVNKLISQFNETINDFKDYDIIKDSITYLQNNINILLFTSFCNNCDVPILLSRFKGFIQSSSYIEIIDILLIKDSININQYNIAIQRNIIKLTKDNIDDDEDYIDFIIDNPFKQIFESIKTKEILFDEFNIFKSSKERSMFQISYGIIKITKNNTTLIPILMKTDPFNLRQNQLITIGKIIVNKEDVYISKCNRCHNNGSMVSYGFKINLFNHK